MDFYDTPEGVAKYVEMADGYDGSDLVTWLAQRLPNGAKVLELGMGPGVDLDLLAAHFTVTGSDQSPLFLDRYRGLHPDADLLELDAVTLETDRRFDGIYSNKVLHHLSRTDLPRSLVRQLALVVPGGIALHAFWLGTHEDEFGGMKFHYWTEAMLREVLPTGWELVQARIYQEMEPDDSLAVVLRRR